MCHMQCFLPNMNIKENANANATLMNKKEREMSGNKGEGAAPMVEEKKTQPQTSHIEK